MASVSFRVFIQVDESQIEQGFQFSQIFNHWNEKLTRMSYVLKRLWKQQKSTIVSIILLEFNSPFCVLYL